MLRISKKTSLNILLASTSKLHKSDYLSYLKPEISNLFASVNDIIFIPYARPGGITHEAYAEKAKRFFSSIGKHCYAITKFDDPVKTLKNASGIFTGGGNTFLLLKQLYDKELYTVLKNKINDGCAYLGTSAGSNICGANIKTTNDMPIVEPYSFKALEIVPYVINPHYIDKPEGHKHQGESRSTRLTEYLSQNTRPVMALPEGTWIRITNSQHYIDGDQACVLFTQDYTKPLKPKTDLNKINV